MRLPWLARITMISAITCTALTLASMASAQVAPKQQNASPAQKIDHAINTQWGHHPGDFVGLERVAKQNGADKVLFSAPKAGLHSVSGAQMQRVQEKLQASQKGRTRDGAQLYDGIPNDAFNVTGEWMHVPASPENGYAEEWLVYGYWQYGSFLGSGAPDNVSGLATENVDPTCWSMTYDSAGSWDYLNDYTGYTAYRYNATTTSSVWNFSDSSDLNYGQSDDHGYHQMSYDRVGTGCNDRMAANNFFEHNQGGTTIGSISISILGLSIGYDAGGSLLKLQKSTGVYYNQ